MSDNITNLSKIIEAKYLASVITQAVTQSGRTAKEKNLAYNNSRVFAQWKNAILQNSDVDSVVREIVATLEQAGIEYGKLSLTIAEILQRRGEIVDEIKQKINESDIPAIRGTRSFDEANELHASGVDMLEPLGGQDKVNVIAGDISWRIANELIERRISEMRGFSKK